MTRGSALSVSLTIVTMATVLAVSGCRQAQTRSGTPTPLPGYESDPAGPSIAPPPPSGAGIPGVPPSTAELRNLEGPFGFTPPKLTAAEPLPALTLPPSLEDDEPANIQPTSSDDETIALPETEVTEPTFSPLPLAPAKPETAAVELDPSLFLLELFEDAALEVPTSSAPPTTVNGLTIQPQPAIRRPSNASRDPLPWPADGVTSTLTIVPGPVMPQWIDEPLPTRAANSRPRRLTIENSDSAIRPIE
jgi:hypothetical protein